LTLDIHDVYDTERSRPVVVPDRAHWTGSASALLRVKTVGPGVREIRIRDAAGAFRVIYIATLADAVYVLHAFQKKAQATSKRDLNLAMARFKQLMRRVER
jgi:phage-related protein